jgi:hypothetical protein
VNIIDSSFWLEYFAGTDYGNIVSEIIENTNDLIIPTITLMEGKHRPASLRYLFRAESRVKRSASPAGYVGEAGLQACPPPAPRALDKKSGAMRKRKTPDGVRHGLCCP